MRVTCLIGALLLVPTLACVGHLEITGAPCPCPKGYTCCPTRNSCIPEHQKCPSSYPISSREPCRADVDCPQNEICETWRQSSGGQLFGPGLCRQSCTTQFPCSQGEVCEPILHNGTTMDSLAALPACVPEQKTAQCRQLSCSACPADRLGATFCQNGNVWGCLVGVHLHCGITCQMTELHLCKFESCEDEGNGAACMTNEPIDITPCDRHNCGDCSVDVGSSGCVGQEIATCTAMPFAGDTCSRICIEQTVQSCSGSCQETPAPVCQQ